MARIPSAFIQELLSRSDIIDIIDSRVSLKKAGKDYQACCPFHNEKTPSFTVSQSKQFYHCFGCGEHGNAISFIMNFDRLSFVESVEVLSARVGLTIPVENGHAPNEKQHADLYQIMHNAQVFYQSQLYQSSVAINYLKGRGLDRKICEAYGVGYAPDGWDNLLSNATKQNTNPNSLVQCGLIKSGKQNRYYDTFRNRIMFPIRDRRGRVVGFGGRIIANEEPKYLNSPETPIFHKSSEVYGLYEALQQNRQLDYALMVEGYMDVMALAQFGFTKAMACMGTANTRLHLERIYRYTQTIVFCFDGDNAGRKAAWRALQNVLPIIKDGLFAKFVFLPQGEDPDTFLRQYGTDAFQTLINDAAYLSDFFWQAISQDINYAVPEGKAALHKLALPLLEQMPQSALKSIMYQKLNSYTGLITQEKQDAQPSTRAQTAKAKITPMRKAIALLIQYPELAQQIETCDLAKITAPGHDLLRELMAFIKANPTCNTASIIEAWRELPHYEALNQLAMLTLLGAQDNAHQEFMDILVQMQNDYYTIMADGLYQKLQNGIISAEEKQMLLSLQKHKQKKLTESEKIQLEQWLTQYN